jgi:hypothetical protein
MGGSTDGQTEGRIDRQKTTNTTKQSMRSF